MYLSANQPWLHIHSPQLCAAMPAKSQHTRARARARARTHTCPAPEQNSLKHPCPPPNTLHTPLRCTAMPTASVSTHPHTPH
eukprot:scaffold4710_cov75-Isochrysis_galbana.AAC.1